MKRYKITHFLAEDKDGNFVKYEDVQAQDEYQGWSNRETWLVNLWLDNDKATYENKLSICLAAGPKMVNAHLLDEYATRRFPGYQLHHFYADMRNAFLARVNWLEIVQSVEE